MQTTIQTRNQAYANIQDMLPEKRKRIYNIISLFGPCTPQQICREENWQHNVVNPRFTELAEVGLIKEVGKIENKFSSNLNTLWEITSDAERIQINNKRFVELRNKKDAILTDFHLNMSSCSIEILKLEIHRIDKQIKNLEKWS